MAAPSTPKRARPTASRAKRKPGRPLVPALSSGQVVNMALEIIDSDGLGALSMRELAKRLGVNAPSLYHYFDGKEAILLAVAHKLIARMPARKPMEAPWREYFVGVMIEYRRVLAAHPNTIGLMAHLRLASLITDSTFEHGTSAMADSGVPPELMLTITEAAEAFVFGWAFTRLGDTTLPELPANGPARRGLTETNTLSEDARFELACYALTDGFITMTDDDKLTRLRRRSARHGTSASPQ